VKNCCVAHMPRLAFPLGCTAGMLWPVPLRNFPRHEKQEQPSFQQTESSGLFHFTAGRLVKKLFRWMAFVMKLFLGARSLK
jgi:hypothetical protein